ncbi:NAD(P)/FAD-dependent oxidoreductase [Flavihumibacter sp. R14]|nr:NAD(P)/FAD-dependent oxidoreductase [Flavihumibacter soli]
MEGNNISVVIVGAGLAGLTSAILLAKQGYTVSVIEKNKFPFHRVCGEYVSNEVLPFLTSIGINIRHLNPSAISRLTVSSVSGKTIELPLQMGGFGISRYVLDQYIYQVALSSGVKFYFDKATNVVFNDEQFSVELASGDLLTSALVIGAYGKRSNLDQKLKRDFFYRRSPYIGIKYHIKTDLPADLIRLDNFQGGYCGTCKIEEDLYNLCYLSETKNLKAHGSIPEMERQLLFKNPHLNRIFGNSDFLFKQPEVINEISFIRKDLVKDHIIYCGDAAGMITPLCGNGMAMAIHSGKILAESIIKIGRAVSPEKRLLMEKDYERNWNRQFAFRLRAGRYIQSIFLDHQLSNIAVRAFQKSAFLTSMLVKSTHGKPF